MKKAIKLLSLLLCLVMAFSLVACGGDNTSSSKDDDDDDKDVSSTASVTASDASSTESTTESSTNSTTETTSQPSGNTDAEEVVARNFITYNGNEAFVVSIVGKGETVLSVVESAGYEVAEGETLTQDIIDEYTANCETIKGMLDSNYTKIELVSDEESIAISITYNLQTAEGWAYYAENGECGTKFNANNKISDIANAFLSAGFEEF